MTAPAAVDLDSLHLDDGGHDQRFDDDGTTPTVYIVQPVPDTAPEPFDDSGVYGERTS